ncbi:MAG TPA: hypothetical protein VJ959_10720 [Desulfotignum sp.]|nr:hypothetical protein [Desulfotignum sp.]
MNVQFLTVFIDLNAIVQDLDICHKHAGLSIALCSTLSQCPPLVVSCARPEVCGGRFTYEQ